MRTQPETEVGVAEGRRAIGPESLSTSEESEFPGEREPAGYDDAKSPGRIRPKKEQSRIVSNNWRPNKSTPHSPSIINR